MRSCADTCLKRRGSRPSERVRIVTLQFLIWNRRTMCPEITRNVIFTSLTHMARFLTITLPQSFLNLTNLKIISLISSFSPHPVSVLSLKCYKMRLDYWRQTICSLKLKSPNGACYLRRKEINMMQSATFDIACTTWILILLMLTNRKSLCRTSASSDLPGKRRIRNTSKTMVEVAL